MKKIIYLFLLVIILFSANAFSQINGCNTVPKLRGPLLIDCQSSSTATSHYYIQDANGISSLYWDLCPSNLVGTIISFPSATEVEVKWSPNAVALNGYLVVSNIGGQGGY